MAKDRPRVGEVRYYLECWEKLVYPDGVTPRSEFATSEPEKWGLYKTLGQARRAAEAFIACKGNTFTNAPGVEPTFRCFSADVMTVVYTGRKRDGRYIRYFEPVVEGWAFRSNKHPEVPVPVGSPVYEKPEVVELSTAFGTPEWSAFQVAAREWAIHASDLRLAEREAAAAHELDEGEPCGELGGLDDDGGRSRTDDER